MNPSKGKYWFPRFYRYHAEAKGICGQWGWNTRGFQVSNVAFIRYYVVNFLYFNTRVFDVDGTGRVSAAELREVLTSLGEKLTEEEVEELFSEGEVDEDGMIDYHTICQAVLQ